MDVVKLDVIADNYENIKIRSMHFDVKYASVLILFISEHLYIECNPMEMQIVWERHMVVIYSTWTLGDEIHNSVVVSSLSPDLSYRLKDEHSIKDEMQPGD